MRPPAFYALEPGGWRDYVNLLHLPYLTWHLSYVVLGAAAAPTFHGDRLGGALLGFALAVGVSAHAFDELQGRPLRTKIARSHLAQLAVAPLVAAAALGVVGAVVIDVRLLAFVGAGTLSVLTYNLELFGGLLHNRFWFAISWGAFPVLTSFWVQSSSITLLAGLVAAGCALLSALQASLSRKAKVIRRGVGPASPADMRRVGSYERALLVSSVAVPIAATAAILARVL